MQCAQWNCEFQISNSQQDYDRNQPNLVCSTVPDTTSIWLVMNNTLRPRQNGRHFPEDIFKCIFLNETVWISIKILLKFVPEVPIYDIPALVKIIAWHPPRDKPLSEPMMVSLLTYVCITRPQWVRQQYTVKATLQCQIWDIQHIMICALQNCFLSWCFYYSLDMVLFKFKNLKW